MLVVWGWGTFDRRNAATAPGRCGACGHRGHLHSYDGLRCFTLFWTPVLPLGRRHVFAECPKCKQGKAMPTRKWARVRNEALTEAATAYERDPRSAEAAGGALGVLLQLGERDLFLELAGRVRAQFANDADMLAELAGAYASVLAGEEALDCYRRSIAVDDRPEVRAALAAELLEQGRAGEAGAEIDRLEERFPDFDASPLAGMREACEARSAKDAPVEPLAEPAPRARSRGLLPVLVVPALLLAALVVYGYRTITAPISGVYVVNGLDEPYDVLVNGRTVSLPAAFRQSLTLPFGEVRIEPAPGGLPIEPAVIEVDQPLFTRAFDDTTLVVNPDRSALFVVETARYSVAGDREPGYEPLFGEPFYVFHGLDYTFSEAPAQISLSSRSQVVTRTALQHVREFPPVDRLNVVGNFLGLDRAVDYARALFPWRPEEPAVLALLVRQLDPGEQAALFEPKLAERPLLVECHRFYQEARQALGENAALIEEYRALLAQEPEDRNLAYLLGRVVSEVDPDEAQRLFGQAVRPPQPSPYGYLGLSFDEYAEGRFDAALAHVRSAMELDGEVPWAADREAQLMRATGEFEPLIERMGALIDSGEADYGTFAYQMILLARHGEEERARELVERALSEGEAAGWTREDLSSARIGLELDLAASLFDHEAYLDAARRGGTPTNRYNAALVEGELERAAALLVEELGPTPEDHLLLFALAAAARRDELARGQLEDALALLDAGTTPQRRLAAWLRGAEEPRVRDVLALGTGESSAVALAALAGAIPERRAELREAALRYCYDNAYLQMLLARSFDG